MEEEDDISLFLSDESSDEEVIFKKGPVIEDNNQVQRPDPILDDQIDAVVDLLETVPGNDEGSKQQDQLDQAEIIEPILEKDEKR